MITKEQALENVKNYIKEKNRKYSYINEEKYGLKKMSILIMVNMKKRTEMFM